MLFILQIGHLLICFSNFDLSCSILLKQVYYTSLYTVLSSYYAFLKLVCFVLTLLLICSPPISFSTSVEYLGLNFRSQLPMGSDM